MLGVDTFLSVGFAVRDSLGEKNLRLLNEYDRYLQLFGNILTPGALHLSPDSRAVHAFVNASRQRHPLLRRLEM